MKAPLCASLLLAGLLGPSFAPAADMGQRTAIVCVYDETRSLTSFGAESRDGRPDEIRSWFTEWLFSDDSSSRSSNLHFLWIPESDSGPQLKVDTKETHHVLVRLRSTTGNSIIASTSASDELTAVAWLFAINFKLEQVMAVSVRSNVGGMKGQAVRLACNFSNDTPALATPDSKTGQD